MSSPSGEPRSGAPGTDSLLTGWGLTMPTRARVVQARDVAEVVDAVTTRGPRGVLARGAGRSYGDAAQNAGGTVIDVAALDDVEVLPDGDVVAGAGALFSRLVPELLSRGRFLPVTPGTRFVTVGGAVAADVHGKNHHRDGSFGAHVRWVDIVTADGAVRRLSTEGEDGRLAAATIGGMGLTGVIVAARFATIAAPSSYLRVDTTRHGDLDSLMARMVEIDATRRYSVAWVDGTARGPALGRGVLTVGEHAEHAPTGRRDAVPVRPRASLPRLPVSPLTKVSVSAFNELWFRRAPRSRDGELQSVAAFFYPLDAVGGWNHLYGRRGFLQYQFVVPDEAGGVVRTVLERLSAVGAASFLSVLKRFGPGRPESPLSFPMPGWTLALDLPVATPGLAAVLDELDGEVLAAGGRHYLAKDSRAVPATIRTGYAGLDRFRAVRDELDPDRAFISDLSRRLDL